MKNFYSFDEYSIPFEIKALFWGLYLVVFVYAAKKMLLSSKGNRRNSDITSLFFIYFVLFAIFYCVSPDYFRYREWIYGRDFDLWNKEKLYIYIVLFCRLLPFSYPFEMFRLIVWGGAILVAYQTFRWYRTRLLPGLTLLLLFVLHAGTFSYARASLAMAVYFLGVALYLLHKGKVLKILGVVMAVSSFYFHREMMIGVAALPCLFIPFDRKNFSFFSIFLLIAAVGAISFFSVNIGYLDSMFDNVDISEKMEELNEGEQRVFRLSTLVNYLRFFYPFYIVTLCLWKKKANMCVVGMYRVTYGILMASIAFMIVFGLRSVYSYRVLYISMIPLALLTSYCYCRGYLKKQQLAIILLLALLSNSVRLINAQ